MDARVHELGVSTEEPEVHGPPPGNFLPAVCDISVTNVCNAACDFCGFARHKMAEPRRYLDPEAFARAVPIMRRRRIKYVTFQGGEPLVHPNMATLVASASQAGMECGLITNGWFLTRHVDELAKAGLKRLLVSLDSHDMSSHEQNRGLKGLGKRISEGIAAARDLGLTTTASVTVNRLVNYEELPRTLEQFGFDSVAFSYPRRAPFGSSSLVYDQESKLIDLDTQELLDALQAIVRMKRHFRVLDPTGAITEVEKFVRGEEQQVPCIGGSKYFYIDWNLDIWRCEAWAEPMGSVFDLDTLPDDARPCNACMMSCYRHASVLMHGAMATADALQAARHGDLKGAIGALRRQGVLFSLWSLSREALPRRALQRARS